MIIRIGWGSELALPRGLRLPASGVQRRQGSAGLVSMYNRTKRKAEELVEQAFGGDKMLKVVDDLEGLARETEGTQNS